MVLIEVHRSSVLLSFAFVDSLAVLETVGFHRLVEQSVGQFEFHLEEEQHCSQPVLVEAE